MPGLLLTVTAPYRSISLTHDSPICEGKARGGSWTRWMASDICNVRCSTLGKLVEQASAPSPQERHFNEFELEFFAGMDWIPMAMHMLSPKPYVQFCFRFGITSLWHKAIVTPAFVGHSLHTKDRVIGHIKYRNKQSCHRFFYLC